MTATWALLLTDLVDSTMLVERLGDAAMADLWAAHDGAARALLEPHHGREIDKTDGFLLLFERPADAVAYALAYHAGLRELAGRLGLPLAARAGLHVGPLILRANSPGDVARGAKPLEVEGLAKPVAARIMGLAVGGQTLLSAEARQALGVTALRTESHGHWRMKGVEEPLELFEVGDAASPFAPPPDGAKVHRVVRQGDLWLPVRQIPHHLPAERDPFVGRQADLQELSRRIDEGARAVTVLGVGGSGKSRLVTRYGWTWLGDWPGGAWFCDLSEARGVDGIVYAVARALDVPLGKEDPVVQLGHAIAGRGRCLVILDNFEQVARHAEATVGRWLDRATQAAFVVTSREVLGLPGELALALAPLPSADAVALFTARARAAKRDFELTEADRPHVEALIHLLDGLPLAIELAAARVRMMPPKTLVARMGERFKLLTSSGTNRRDRQSTLRGALDWSWNLLRAAEQAALAQLSVFEGGFDLEAAEAVLDLSDHEDAPWPLDAVQSLVDKSLVVRVSDDRFDMLVSIQEYAAERLTELGSREAAELRHGAWFARLGDDDALDALDRHGGVERRRALTRELDNLAAGSRRAVARADGPAAAGCARAAFAVLLLRGPTGVGLALLEAARRVPGLAIEVTARLDNDLGRGWWGQGRLEAARAQFDRAEAAFLACAERRFVSRVIGNRALVLLDERRFAEAERAMEGGLAIAREIGDRAGEGALLCNLGVTLHRQNRFDEALARHVEALAALREVGNLKSEANALGNLGSTCGVVGRKDQERDYNEQALALHQAVGNRRSEAAVTSNLAGLDRATGRIAEASSGYRRALTLAREVGDRRLETHLSRILATMLLEQGQIELARPLYEEAIVIAREVGDRLTEGHLLGFLGMALRELGQLDAARAAFESGLAAHRATAYADGVQGALAYLALVAAEEGRRDDALSSAQLAVAVERCDPMARADAWVTLARVRLARGEVAPAREALDAARALAPTDKLSAILAAVDSRVAVSEGRLDRAAAALAEACAKPAWVVDRTELGRVVAEARAGLAQAN